VPAFGWKRSPRVLRQGCAGLSVLRRGGSLVARLGITGLSIGALGWLRALDTAISVSTWTGVHVGAADSEQVASESLARWYQAWNAHDVDAIGALVTDDVLYEDPSAPTAVMRGRAPVKQYAGATFAGIPDLCLERLEEWVTPGLPPLAPTGLPIELFGMDRSEIRDGKLARHQIFWDMVELGRQIGAFPKGGRARRGSRAIYSNSLHAGCDGPRRLWAALSDGTSVLVCAQPPG
jgi:hypothetical protein